MGILLNRGKNILLNGACSYWQRQLSVTSTTLDRVYAADRFCVESGGSGANIITERSTDVPANTRAYYSMLSRVAGGVSLITASQNQIIETYLIKDLVGKKVTLSFWIKKYGNTSEVSILIASPSSGVSDSWTGARIIVDENTELTQNISISDQWERKSFTFTIPASCSNGMSVGVFKNLPVGDGFYTTMWQLEEGETASNFEMAHVHDALELQALQRYFEKSWAASTPPGTNTYTNMVNVTAFNTTGAMPLSFFQTYKRGNPVVTIYGRTGTINKVGTFNGTTDIAGLVTSVDASQRRINTIVMDSAVFTLENTYRIHFTADAEL